MVHTTCAVRGCSSSSRLNKELKFHQFPHTNARCSVWIKACKRDDLTENSIDLKYKYVCSLHFEKRMYGKKHLRKYAFPTLNLSPIRLDSVNNLMNPPSENRLFENEIEAPIVQLQDHSFEQTEKVQNANENIVTLEDFSDDEDCKWEIENSIQSKRAKLTDENPAEELSDGSTDQIVRTLHEIVNQLHTLKSSDNQRDHYDIFGNYVASLLRKLPEDKALRLQPDIINLIVSADLDNTELKDDNTITPDV